MADIELVIKIPDHLYKLLMELPSDSNEGTIENVLMKAVEHGTPLPKGHGRLIDVDDIREIELEDSLHLMQYKKGGETDVYIDAPTIIEADKESGE